MDRLPRKLGHSSYPKFVVMIVGCCRYRSSISLKKMFDCSSPPVSKSLVTPRPVAGVLEKMFRSDYPRLITNRLWLWWFPILDALPVAPTLPIAFLLASRRFPVSLLRFPPRPLPRLLPAWRAATALARPTWTEDMLAPSADNAGAALSGAFDGQPLAFCTGV
jgi:hypothetical protein